VSGIEQALAHHQAGRLGEAEAIYREILVREPNHADALHWLGVIAFQMGRHDDAIELIERALGARPDHAPAHNNLGLALQAKGRLAEAEAAFRRALEYDPQDPEVHNNLGLALSAAGVGSAALTAFEHALALRPDYAEAHFNRGMSLLSAGRLEEGWAEYEWRLACPEHTQASGVIEFPQPKWGGRRFPDQTLLVHSEQGLGDAIQMTRYLPMVKARGGRVLLACEPSMRRLLDRLPGIDIVTRDDTVLSSSGIFDLHMPMMSLPRIFSNTLATVPKDVPYLTIEPTLAADWRRRLGSDTYNVGLCWAGGPKFQNDRKRSIALAAFAPLATARGVTFYSLQKGPAADQAARPPAGMQLVDWSGELHDFADTAALTMSLDLVISVDTAVAHLAGALARPVWTLLPYAPDWRWLLDRSDSPWYPTMRLFRQPHSGDWANVTERVASELSRVVRR
jgi:Flp pilus assembly protein TadD